MNREQARILAPIVAAFGEGKEVEYIRLPNTRWGPATSPNFDPALQWRIKLEPRTFKIAVKGNEKILLFASTSDTQYEKMGYTIITATENL